MVKYKGEPKLGVNVVIGDYTIVGEIPNRFSGVPRVVIGNDALIRSHNVIYHGVKIGRNFQSGHFVMIREYCIIGDNASIGTHSILEHNVSIGSNVRVHSNCFIPEYTVLLDHCWVGPCVTFLNTWHPLCKDAKDCSRERGGVVVGTNAIIGAASIISPGVRIGESAFVASGSLVLYDVLDRKVVAGSPAKIIHDDIDELECKAGRVFHPYREIAV